MKISHYLMKRLLMASRTNLKDLTLFAILRKTFEFQFRNVNIFKLLCLLIVLARRLVGKCERVLLKSLKGNFFHILVLFLKSFHTFFSHRVG